MEKKKNFSGSLSTVLYGLNCSTVLSFLLVLSPAYWSLKNDREGHMQLPDDLPYQTKPTRRREILVHLWKAPGFSFQCELFLWLFFLLDPIWCQNSQPPHRSGSCLIFFYLIPSRALMWSALCCTSRDSGHTTPFSEDTGYPNNYFNKVMQIPLPAKGSQPISQLWDH